MTDNEKLQRVRELVQRKRDALANAGNLFMWQDADEVLRLLDEVLSPAPTQTCEQRRHFEEES